MRLLLKLLGGASALFLAMGVARFAFTPLLPLMQKDFQFSDTVSGMLASVNYLGYLLGAFYARYVSVKKYAHKFFIISILLSLLFVALMYIDSPFVWYLLRFLSGFLSAVVFVISAEFTMDYLSKIYKPQYGGVIYTGIGGGMVLSGLTIPFLSAYFNSSEIWLWLAGLSFLPAVFAITFTHKPDFEEKKRPKNTTGVNRQIALLMVSYMLEGLGYIITGTFISVIVLRGTGSVALSGYVWVIAGLGAVFITPLWPVFAKKFGMANAIITAFAVQSVAIATPVFSHDIVPTLLGAVWFGGTFLGIVSLTLAFGRHLSPGGTTTSGLTLFFSTGQMAGPFIAGYLADKTGGFDIAVLIAAFASVTGGLLVYVIKKMGSVR